MNHFFDRVNKGGLQRVAVVTLLSVFCVFVPIVNQSIKLEQNFSTLALEHIVPATSSNKKPGVIVLGMGRSGTSMLSGILVKGFGYEAGGPLIGPRSANEKGYYERVDVVIQNDEFFKAQGMSWGHNAIYYDSEKSLLDEMLDKNFEHGNQALRFFNNHNKTLPYLQKDPRMCITLPTWLKLLDDEPAVVFTYRHPLEVALSMKKRDRTTIEDGLKLWIVYNMRAIQNSAGLCRVLTSNEKIMSNPTREVQRIKDQLTDRCKVLPPPKSLISQSVVDSFIDPNLQHNGKMRKNSETTSRILKDFGEGCIAREFESVIAEGSSKFIAERKVFLMAMQLFCDLENGTAYKEGYEWPELWTIA